MKKKTKDFLEALGKIGLLPLAAPLAIAGALMSKEDVKPNDSVEDKSNKKSAETIDLEEINEELRRIASENQPSAYNREFESLIVNVVGVRGKKSQQLIDDSRLGQEIIVTRDLFKFDNPDAMAVYIDNKLVGYVEKKHERYIAERFDQGCIIIGQVQEKTQSIKNPNSKIKGLKIRTKIEKLVGENCNEEN